MDNIDEKVIRTANQLANICLNIDIKVAVAESCTGGWLSKSLTDIAGSSEWFEGGFVSYSNEAKMSMISVNKSTLESHGAVSKAVVIEMAHGVLKFTNATLSVAISGIAGPGGGTEEKPVGLVWLAYANINNSKISVTTEQHVYKGDRSDVRSQAVLQALSGLLKIANKTNGK